MKIRELEPQPLEEGFLDNLISKVKTLSADDGSTGIIRALQGNNAALNKFADSIVNAARPKILQRLGNNLNAIQTGAGKMPIQIIYNQALAVAIGIAQKDNISVETPTVKQVVKQNRNDILRMVLNGDSAADDAVRMTYDAVMSGTPEADLGKNIDEVTKTVALIIASAVIFIQTSQEDTEAEGYELDDTLVDAFNELGNKISVTLATNSPTVEKLKVNEIYKEKVEALITNIVKTIHGKYLNLDVTEIANMVATPPSLISTSAVANAISSHTSDITDEDRNNAVNLVTPALNDLFAKWLKIASTESTPGRPESYEVLRHWGAEFLNRYLPKLEISAAKRPTEEPAPDSGSTIDELTAKINALSDAEKNQLLADNPDLVRRITTGSTRTT